MSEQPQDPTQLDVSSSTESNSGPPAGDTKSTWGSVEKSYAWRVTAIVAWVKILAALFGLYGAFNQLETILAEKFVALLSSFGFTPVNTNLLPTIIKAGWLLLITRFTISELLGLLIYTLTFPVWVPVKVLISRFDGSSERRTDEQDREGLRTRRKNRFPFFAVCAGLFIGWLLLFGSASTRKELLPGLILSGVLFLLVVYRLFLKANPGGRPTYPLMHWLVRVGHVGSGSALSRVRKAKGFTKRGEISNYETIGRLHRRLDTKILLFLRRQLIQSRISLYVLIEYIASLIMACAASVVFWALAVKFEALTIPLAVCLHFSISHTLPGIETPDVTSELSLWCSIGPAATAWILFVVYIGPASSLLPERQKRATEGLRHVYENYRHSVVALGNEARMYKALRKRLPE